MNFRRLVIFDQVLAAFAALALLFLASCAHRGKFDKMADDAPIRIRAKSEIKMLESGYRLVGLRTRDGSSFLFSPQQRSLDGKDFAQYLVPIDEDRALLLELTRASGPREPMTAGQAWVVQNHTPPQVATGIFIYDEVEVRGNATLAGQEFQVALNSSKVRRIDVSGSGQASSTGSSAANSKSPWSFAGFEDILGRYGLALRRVR